MKRSVAIAFLMFFIASCGSSTDTFSGNVTSGTDPIVSRIDPATGPVGQEITIYGIGFSIEPPSNIVMIGNVSTTATSHGFVAAPTDTEFEYIVATVPADTPAGANSVTVLVYDSPSNSDITFTVTP